MRARPISIDRRFAIALACTSAVALATMALGAWFPDATPPMCSAGLHAILAGGVGSLDFAMRTKGALALAAGAFVMIVAMMAPAWSEPFLYLWHRSLSRHRWRAIALFCLGYLAVWMLALPLFLVLGLFATQFGLDGTGIGIGLLALMVPWHLSRARQRMLANCHRKPGIAIFGFAALSDPIGYGATQGGWCVATCWGWMLLPFCWPALHMPLTAVTAVIIARERRVPTRYRQPTLQLVQRIQTAWATVRRPWRYA